MPRKDRRFTGEDLRRIYCKNLNARQRRLFDIIECDWEDYSSEEKAEKVMDVILEIAEEVIQFLPYSNLLSLAIDGIKLLLDGEIGDIFLLPVPEQALPAPRPLLPFR